MKLRPEEISFVETGGNLLILPDSARRPSLGSHPLIPDGIDPVTRQPFYEPEAFAFVKGSERHYLALLDTEVAINAGFKRINDLWRAFQRRYRIRDYDLPETRVILVNIEYEKLQRPRLMATQHGQVDPAQYVTSASRCIDREAGESPDEMWMAGEVADLHAGNTQRRAARKVESLEDFKARTQQARAIIEAFDPGDDQDLQKQKRKALRALNQREAA